jgi:type II secretory pathway component PulC
VCYGIALASSLSLDVKNSLIDLKAEDVPLIDILKAISGKTGLLIKSGDTLTERVSCEFKEISLEKVIKQLLNKRSYAMGYREAGDNLFVPTEVWVVSGSNFESTIQPSPPEDSIKSYQKDWFRQEFEDENRLLNQISANPSSVGPNIPAILITKISENSSFQKIGLKEGDVIHDVNGKPISTVRDFIQILKTVSTAEEPNLMISLTRSDKSTNPIYVHFR